jgi:hypothetical protein
VVDVLWVTEPMHFIKPRTQGVHAMFGIRLSDRARGWWLALLTVLSVVAAVLAGGASTKW